MRKCVIMRHLIHGKALLTYRGRELLNEVIIVV